MKLLPSNFHISITHVTSECESDVHDISSYEIDKDRQYYIGIVMHDAIERSPKSNVPPNYVGFSDFGWQNGRFVCLSIEVQPEYQRRGLATIMYNIAEVVVGEKLSPSEILTDAARIFWDRRMWHKNS